MTTRAALAIWVDIDPEDHALFNLWHSREHFEERVGCPGWRRGSRFRAPAPLASGRSRYLLFYDAETTAAFETPTYYARLGNPSPLSRAIFPRFRDTSRTVCTVEQRWGEGIGSAALTLRLPYGERAPFDEMAALQPARVDLLTGQPSMGQASTTEKDLRGQSDRQIEQALIAFFWSMDAAEAARNEFAPSAELFSLLHSVSKDDLPPDHL